MYKFVQLLSYHRVLLYRIENNCDCSQILIAFLKAKVI
uniref:Uncharacterized protein n=1 Tax=Siphoviridae sp. ctOba29 TaxID=2825480 RepID=A0A8S5NXK8_9CAUD|nr:MAG TPA: hypothetical protein [Siphoviridae sp. ctOba29]